MSSSDLLIFVRIRVHSWVKFPNSVTAFLSRRRPQALGLPEVVSLSLLEMHYFSETDRLSLTYADLMYKHFS